MSVHSESARSTGVGDTSALEAEIAKLRDALQPKPSACIGPTSS